MKPNGMHEMKIKLPFCNQLLNHYYDQIAAFAKPAFTVIIMLLVTSEVLNFISLKGYEMPVAFSLFKIAMYTLALLFIKFNDNSSMTYVINNFKEANFAIINKLEELVRISKMLAIERRNDEDEGSSQETRLN